MSGFQDPIENRVKREPSDEPQGRVDSYPQTYHGYDSYHSRREPSGDRQERPRNRWGNDIKRETSRERDERPSDRWGDERRRELSRDRHDQSRDRRVDDHRRELSRDRHDQSRDRRVDDHRRERSRDREDRSRDRLDGHDRRDSRRAFDDRQRDRSRDGFKREPSYEHERRPRSPWGDRDEGPITGRADSRERECSPLTGDDEPDDRKDSTRSIRRDLTKNYTKENDPYWYPGKGKYSHPTKMPSQNPHDPKPRNPKRTQSCRTESPGHRHERFERKHDRRESEKERLLNGDIGTPPPDAGPNWAKNRIATLEKYAKRTKKRHKKHEKRVRKAGEQGQA